MAVYGYCRASSTSQSTDIQREALRAAGAGLVLEEKRSGTKLEGRDQLEVILAALRPGDMMLVTRVDRLARSAADLHAIAKRIEAAGANLRATEQAFDTSRPEGKALFGILGVFAEFETNIRKERQAEGIARAKEADKALPREERAYKGGRGRSIDRALVRRLKGEGVAIAEIARQAKCSRETVYQILKENGE